MQSRFLAAVSATIFTFAASATTAQAQTMDASKKKIENITNHGAVPASNTPKTFTGYTANPPKRKTDLQIAAPPAPSTTPESERRLARTEKSEPCARHNKHNDVSRAGQHNDLSRSISAARARRDNGADANCDNDSGTHGHNDDDQETLSEPR